MEETTGLVTFEGAGLTLLGSQVRAGQQAPDFTAIANDLTEVSLSDFRGKVAVIASVPSLDTSVCDREARRFNQEATGLGEDVVVLAISMDLPFAQTRWCAAAGVRNARTLSDHRDGSFGTSYGVLIKELRLLARAVWVVGPDGKVCYYQLVGEVTDEPDYDAAIAAASQALPK